MKLLDTSTLVDNLRRGLESGAISVVTLIGLLRGVEQEKRGVVKKLLEKSFEVPPLSNEAILKYCEIYSHLKQRGELMPGVNLLIATTALVNNAALITKDGDLERLAEIGLRLEHRGDRTQLNVIEGALPIALKVSPAETISI